MDVPARVRATLPVLAMLVGCLAAMIEGAWSQPDREHVRLILSHLPPHGSAAYQAIKKRAGKATGQALPLTKSEMWSMPRGNAEAVRAAATAQGLGVHELGSDWNHLFHLAPADVKLSAQQKAMVDQARGAKATQDVHLVVASAPSLVEYALTADMAAKKATSAIALSIAGGHTLTIRRRSVDLKRDMCVWRGAVEGTDGPAMIMWWPQGKLTGSVQHAGHLYSIRHLGGDVHAIIEMAEERMPDDHPPGR
jgi:hypothetical protein